MTEALITNKRKWRKFYTQFINLGVLLLDLAAVENQFFKQI